MLRHTKVSALAALAIALCFAAGSVHANCTSPAGKETDIIYNGDYHTYQFCNGTSWISEGGIGTGGPITFISTQTASSSASLQFTNLPTSYNTLFLNCSGLLAGTNAVSLYVQVGEGATPTWETGSHYTTRGFAYGYPGGGPYDQGTATGVDLTAGNGVSSTYPTTVKLYIDTVGSSTLYKNVTYWEGTYYSPGSTYYYAQGISFWNNDTNPITALQVSMSSGNIASGTCSLYGMN